MSRSRAAAGLFAACALLSALPARAFPLLGEPYPNLIAARPFLVPRAEARPRDALQSQPTRPEAPRERWLAGAGFRNEDRGSLWGGGLSFAALPAGRPFALHLSAFHLDPDGPGGGLATLDAGGKAALWYPDDPRLPVVSLAGRYFDPDDLGRRWDLLLALDQRLAPRAFLTLNVGFARGNVGLPGRETDLVAGFGATWAPHSRLSVSFDYVLENDLDGEDRWGLAGTWTLGRSAALRVGGGDDGMLSVAYLLKWDAR